MTHSIYKYQLEIQDYQEVRLPQGAEILTVQEQYGIPCLWARVNTEESRVTHRTIAMHGSGHEMSQPTVEAEKYIGTFQIHSGSLVFHVFESI